MSKAQENKNSNLITRAVTGAIYVTVVVLCSYLGGLTLQIVFGIVTALMLYEFAQLFKDSEYNPSALLLTIYGAAMYTFGALGASLIRTEGANFFLLPLLLLLLFSVIFFGSFEIFRNSEKPVSNVGISILGLIYIVPAMTLIPYISLLGPDDSANMFPLLGIFIMIWSSDTFAYLIGRKIGKTKLAPSVSPNKSWEGFVGGLIFSIIAGLVIAYFIEGQPFLAYAVLGVICAGIGLLGDLFESKIKRQLNLKDSGTILPGHGGLLDRFDSVLFVMPVAFMVCVIFMFIIK